MEILPRIVSFQALIKKLKSAKYSDYFTPYVIKLVNYYTLTPIEDDEDLDMSIRNYINTRMLDVV